MLNLLQPMSQLRLFNTLPPNLAPEDGKEPINDYTTQIEVKKKKFSAFQSVPKEYQVEADQSLRFK